ncbi:hypothetical protein FB451DRAFT_1363778 [Mycena latifolia]|nr:hypothetical protein FB451DRAFT_1363778 [Mycena latifolia]
MYYSAAGEKGTIEARGLERQRKFDGLRRWKFDTVMQIFPLLLQLGLLLFVVALSVYLWTIHLSLAIIVLTFTSFGIVTYIALLVSAVLSPDSPFQTPLVPLVARLIPKTLLMRAGRFLSRVATVLLHCVQRSWSACASHLLGVRDVLPYFFKVRPQNRSKAKRFFSSVILVVLFPFRLMLCRPCIVARRVRRLKYQDSLLIQPKCTMTPLPKPSLEVPAVSWVLETSTDPVMIAAAAEITVELQWPMSADLTPQISRLRDTALGCFEHKAVYKITDDGPIKGINLDRVRDGMDNCAVRCGQAYSLLRACLGTDPSLPKPDEGMVYCADYRPFEPPELHNVVRILAGSPKLTLDTATTPSAVKSALRAIPSLVSNNLPNRKKMELKSFLDQFQGDNLPHLDASSFTDYLFCLITFLTDMDTFDLVRADKSMFQAQLFQHLFDILDLNLQYKRISMDTAVNLVDITGRLASRSESDVWTHNFRDCDRQSIVYPFCSELPQEDGWLRLVLAAGMLTGSHNYWPRPTIHNAGASWVYKALESIDTDGQEEWDSRTVTRVASLLQALLYYDAHPAPTVHDYNDPLTIKRIHLLLQALSTSGDISRISAHLLVRSKVMDWFKDDDLRTILQTASVWSSLARVSLELEDHFQFSKHFIRLGRTLSDIPDWHSHVRRELCSWITTFLRGEGIAESLWGLAQEYNTVLSRVWRVNTTGYDFLDHGERALALTFVAISTVWADFDFTASGSVKPWLDCTSIALSYGKYFSKDNTWIKTSPQFQQTFTMPLASSLLKAADRARTTLLGNSSNGSENLFEKEETLQRVINGAAEHHFITEIITLGKYKASKRELKEERKLNFVGGSANQGNRPGEPPLAFGLISN